MVKLIGPAANAAAPARAHKPITIPVPSYCLDDDRSAPLPDIGTRSAPE